MQFNIQDQTLGESHSSSVVPLAVSEGLGAHDFEVPFSPASCYLEGSMIRADTWLLVLM